MLNPSGVVLRGRAAAEALMVDACTIARVTGSTTDPETGEKTPTTATVYTGRCKVQRGGIPTGEPHSRGEASVQVMHQELHLPMSATGVLVDDIATVTASQLDADLVGKRFTIRAVAHKTFLTARRFDVQEVGS